MYYKHDNKQHDIPFFTGLAFFGISGSETERKVTLQSEWEWGCP